MIFLDNYNDDHSSTTSRSSSSIIDEEEQERNVVDLDPNIITNVSILKKTLLQIHSFSKQKQKERLQKEQFLNKQSSSIYCKKGKNQSKSVVCALRYLATKTVGRKDDLGANHHEREEVVIGEEEDDGIGNETTRNYEIVPNTDNVALTKVYSVAHNYYIPLQFTPFGGFARRDNDNGNDLFGARYIEPFKPFIHLTQ